MANRHRGEISAELGGATHALCLTLGALAELEDAYGAAGLAGLAARFEGGAVSARDLTRIIGAGLRGAGAKISDDEVAKLSHPAGLPGYARIAASLLAATFGGETLEAQTPQNPPAPQDA